MPQTIIPGQVWHDGRRLFTVLKVHPSRVTVEDADTKILAAVMLSRFANYELVGESA